MTTVAFTYADSTRLCAAARELPLRTAGPNPAPDQPSLPEIKERLSVTTTRQIVAMSHACYYIIHAKERGDVFDAQMGKTNS